MAGSNLPEFCLDYRKYTVEMISEPTAAIIKKVRKQMDDVASVPDDKVSDGRVRQINCVFVVLVCINE